jgi:SAM-dependent methyltransferase
MIPSAGNPLFDLQQTIYNSRNYTRRRLHRTRLDWVANSIRKYVLKFAAVKGIEYGPGSGIYLPVLSEFCEMVTAADIESAYLDGIRPLLCTLPNLHLMTDDIQASTFDNDNFDLILCSEVLEHVPKPEQALNTLYRILKPGGIAIVTTPQRFSLMELTCKLAFLPGVIDVVRFIYREPILETGHISLRSGTAFGASLKNCGFQTLEHECFGLYLPLVAEFGGEMGGRLLETLEKYMRKGRLSGLLWTQAYVLRKPV